MYSTHNAFSALLLMVYQALVCDDFLCVITDLFDGTPQVQRRTPTRERTSERRDNIVEACDVPSGQMIHGVGGQ